MNGFLKEHFKVADVIEIALLVFAILTAYFTLKQNDAIHDVRLGEHDRRLEGVERCCNDLTRRTGG